jgi:hypothetical protein
MKTFYRIIFSTIILFYVIIFEKDFKIFIDNLLISFEKNNKLLGRSYFILKENIFVFLLMKNKIIKINLRILKFKDCPLGNNPNITNYLLRNPLSYFY